MNTRDLTDEELTDRLRAARGQAPLKTEAERFAEALDQLTHAAALAAAHEVAERLKKNTLTAGTLTSRVPDYLPSVVWLPPKDPVAREEASKRIRYMFVPKADPEEP